MRSLTNVLLDCLIANARSGNEVSVMWNDFIGFAGWNVS